MRRVRESSRIRICMCTATSTWPTFFTRLCKGLFSATYHLTPFCGCNIHKKEEQLSLVSLFLFFFFLGPRCLATVCQLCRVAWHYYAILLKKRKGKQGLGEQKSWNNKAGEKRRRESEESGGRGRRERGREDEWRAETGGHWVRRVLKKPQRKWRQRERVSG